MQVFPKYISDNSLTVQYSILQTSIKFSRLSLRTGFAPNIILTCPFIYKKLFLETHNRFLLKYFLPWFLLIFVSESKKFNNYCHHDPVTPPVMSSRSSEIHTGKSYIFIIYSQPFSRDPIKVKNFHFCHNTTVHLPKVMKFQGFACIL